MKKLAREELELLKQILWKRARRLLKTVEHLGDEPMSEEMREDLRGFLSDELCNTGMSDDDVINERGMKIDELISRLAEF